MVVEKLFLRVEEGKKFRVSEGFPTDPHPIPKILDIFKGGSVQNPDPSGACGGLFKKLNCTFHITVKCINFIQGYSL